MDEASKQQSNTDFSPSLDYVRRVYTNNIDWYKNADTKAEIVLTLDGIFLAFVTSSIFVQQADLREILAYFTFGSWLFLGLMSLALAGSIFCAIACLWSRISLIKYIKEKYFAEHKTQVDQIEPYRPETTFFFQKISRLDPDLYQRRLLSVDQEFEIMALAADTHTLAGNVLEKHVWVDLSFILAGASLLSFLALGISYLLALMRV
jgi:hypothetical protein